MFWLKKVFRSGFWSCANLDFTRVPYHMTNGMLERAGLCCSLVPAEQQPGGGVGAAGAAEASHRDQILHVHSCSASSNQVQPTGFSRFFTEFLDILVDPDPVDLALRYPNPYWECRSRSRSKGLRKKAFVPYVL